MIPPTRAKSANDSTIPGAAKLIPKTDGFLETARIALEQALPWKIALTMNARPQPIELPIAARPRQRAGPKFWKLSACFV